MLSTTNPSKSACTQGQQAQMPVHLVSHRSSLWWECEAWAFPPALTHCSTTSRTPVAQVVEMLWRSHWIPRQEHSLWPLKILKVRFVIVTGCLFESMQFHIPTNFYLFPYVATASWPFRIKHNFVLKTFFLCVKFVILDKLCETLVGSCRPRFR